MNPKPFKTIDQQISILKSRGLLIQNEEAAKKIFVDMVTMKSLMVIKIIF